MTWQRTVSGQVQSTSSHAVNGTKISLGLVKLWALGVFESLPQFSEIINCYLNHFLKTKSIWSRHLLWGCKNGKVRTAQHMDTKAARYVSPFYCITDLCGIHNLSKDYNCITATPSAQYMLSNSTDLSMLWLPEYSLRSSFLHSHFTSWSQEKASPPTIPRILPFSGLHPRANGFHWVMDKSLRNITNHKVMWSDHVR